MAEVAIIGAGVMGLATARALSRTGREVVVYEQFEPGHARGSSHGRSRVFRLAYAQPEWVRLAQEALAGWRRIEVEAGIVRADRALAALARGIDVRYGTRVTSLTDLREACVVVTAGAWVNDLVKPPLPVRVTRETVCYFVPVDARPMPAFVSVGLRTGGISFYALADPVHGIKAAAHGAGPQVDPSQTGGPDAALVGAITAWIGEHVLLADPRPIDAQACLYTSTADQSFILERHGRIVVGSACSGHGFKFAPAIGARL